MSEGYVYDDAARARVTAALAAVDRSHALHPECSLCGQRTTGLDRFGLCSKVSVPHEEWRAEMRANEKTGAR